MPFINGGVNSLSEGVFRPVTTKAELKRLISTEPGSVHFYPTSEYGERFSGEVTDLPATDVKLSVCGPNPYSDRRWYATIYRSGGKLLVK